ncbi:MAG: hypothetical protein ABWZ16_05395 [Microbacterium sp.]
MTENSSHPDHTPLTVPGAETPAIAPAAQPPAPRRSRTRTWLIAGGSVLAAAVLAGGGIAVGAAIADEMDDDDDDRASASAEQDDDGDTAVSQADIGTESAAELNEIIAAAADSAEGDAIGIEANADGSWDVQFETGDGAETEVRVSEDGTTEVLSTNAAEADDTAPPAVLDADTVDALVAAAMDEVSGNIADIEIDDDTASPFDISVVQSNGRTIDVELDAAMTVVAINPTQS